MSTRKQKKYEDYKKERPTQLDLFSFNNIFESKRDKYSGTVELYDVLPKYIHNDVENLRENGKYLDIISRNFVYKKQSMQVFISPARLVLNNQITKDFFPSQREEIIEDVLRKFATDSNRNEFLDDRLSVKFTMYDLWKELKKIKHPYKYHEIKEGLDILNKTNLEIRTKDNKITFSSNMFESFGVVNKNEEEINFDITDEEKNKKVGKNIIYFVRFNSLVSNSIKDRNWRIINYEQCMKYKRAVSRWLHKRISHLFLSKEIELPYNILLSTIIRDSGMTAYTRINDNLIQVQKCLAEMVNIGSIDKYFMEKIYSKERKNKLVDVKFLIYVSHTFFDDIALNNIILDDNYTIQKNYKLETYNQNTIEIKQLENDDIIKKDKLTTNQEDLLNIKDLKILLKDFSFSDSELNKIISYKNDKSFENIKKNIICAIEYINKEQQNNKKCNEIAIITSAIKNDWNNQNVLTDLLNINNFTKNKDEIVKDLLSNITNEKYKKISNLFIKYFGEDVYISWISKLKFVSIKGNILNLSCNNQFVIDKIKNDYLNGIQTKDSNGNKYWYKKGLNQIVNEILPNIKKINIEYLE